MRYKKKYNEIQSFLDADNFTEVNKKKPEQKQIEVSLLDVAARSALNGIQKITLHTFHNRSSEGNYVKLI